MFVGATGARNKLRSYTHRESEALSYIYVVAALKSPKLNIYCREYQEHTPVNTQMK